jgi:predicted hydrolase (HD superfamily)
MPETPMEWSLVTCDDLTGLIVAVALVHPTKLAGVSVESVMKKFDSKSFASGADRERIKLCEEKLDVPLEAFVGIVLDAMKEQSDLLGL